MPSSAGGKDAGGGAGSGGILKSEVKQMAEALGKREKVKCNYKWLARTPRLNGSGRALIWLVQRTGEWSTFEITKHACTGEG